MFPAIFPRKNKPAEVPPTHVSVVVSAPRSNSGDNIDLNKENIKSVVAPGEVVEGTMKLKYGIKIDGAVVGAVDFGKEDGLLVLNKQAQVVGDIHGPRAIILGEVRGNIVITGRLILLSSARVIGDIAAGSIQINEGAHVSGRMLPISELQNTINHDSPEAFTGRGHDNFNQTFAGAHARVVGGEVDQQADPRSPIGSAQVRQFAPGTMEQRQTVGLG